MRARMPWLFLALFIASCTTPSESPIPKVRHSQPEDLPVPTGFVFIPETSYVYSTGTFRSGEVEWRGSLPVGEVAAFFESRMPDDGWDPVGPFEGMAQKRGEGYQLAFRKNLQDATIQIRPLPDHISSPHRVQILARISSSRAELGVL